MSLKELGLKLGDAFTLKALLETQERKRKLLEILQKKAGASKCKHICTKDNSGKTAERPTT